jgi:hypothetical protein
MNINQATTAIEHFHDPATQRMLRNHEEIVFAILSGAAPGDMTLKEIACRFNEWTGYAVPDSSLCSPLNILKTKGRITDRRPKRPCRVNGIRKKAWALADAQDSATGEVSSPADSVAESASTGWGD